jgi:t-SNARE complex subunit (syntaxin)
MLEAETEDGETIVFREFNVYGEDDEYANAQEKRRQFLLEQEKDLHLVNQIMKDLESFVILQADEIAEIKHQIAMTKDQTEETLLLLQDAKVEQNKSNSKKAILYSIPAVVTGVLALVVTVFA